MDSAEGSPTPGEILARLDRIPVWPYPRRVLGFVSAGIFRAFFDIVTIAAALPVLVDQLGVTAKAILAVLGALLGPVILRRV